MRPSPPGGSPLSGTRIAGSMLVRCSLCGMILDESDPLIAQRKRRHAQWHDPRSTSYRRNAVLGTVSWDPA